MVLVEVLNALFLDDSWIVGLLYVASNFKLNLTDISLDFSNLINSDFIELRKEE